MASISAKATDRRPGDRRGARIGPESSSRKRAIGSTQRLLRTIVEGTATSVGEDFFNAVVRHLALALDVRYAFVTERLGPGPRVRMLAFWGSDDIRVNAEYDLSGSLCARVLAGEVVQYEREVQAHFPGDDFLVRLAVESYLAIPLKGSAGQVLGHLAVMHDRPMPEGEPRYLPTLEIFAARAAAELERKRAETELRKAEARLFHAEKMSALGQITAAITHEINTPAGVILGSVDVSARVIAKLRAAMEEETASAMMDRLGEWLQVLAENVETISHAGRRISETAASLRKFARLDEDGFRLADLHEGLESAVALVRGEVGVRVVRRYGAIPAVWCSASELNQVFLTLLTNAAEAIAGEGTITVGTTTDGETVVITVADTGKGMDPVQLESLFDIGFAIKGSRVGMRIGLCRAYNVIKQHGGELNVTSRRGHGTTFTIRLPVRANTDSGTVH